MLFADASWVGFEYRSILTVLSEAAVGSKVIVAQT
jgi:hypothetical protein